MITVKELKDKQFVKTYIEKNHYSHKIPQAVKYRLGLYLEDKLKGVAIFSIPANQYSITSVFRDETQKIVIELSRVYTEDGLEKNFLSKVLSQCFKYLKNKETLNKKNNLYQRKKRKTNVNYRLKCYIRRRINLALETDSKRSKVLKLLGCSIEFLKSYLESKFKPNMTWKNHSQFGWHIDHIRPCCTFDLSKPKEQRKCFHYTNLQPLWWQANIRKGHKYEK